MLLFFLLFQFQVQAKTHFGWDHYFSCMTAIGQSSFLLGQLSPSRANSYLSYNAEKKIFVIPDGQNIGWGKHNRMAVYTSDGVFDCRFEKKGVSHEEPSALVSSQFFIELKYNVEKKKQQIVGFKKPKMNNQYKCARGGKDYRFPDEVRLILATAVKSLDEKMWPFDPKPKLKDGSAELKGLRSVIKACQKIPRYSNNERSPMAKASRRIHKIIERLMDHYPEQLTKSFNEEQSKSAQ